MRASVVLLVAVVGLATILAVQVMGNTQPAMMHQEPGGPGHMTPQQMQMMQQQLAQMTATLQTMRAQLDKINPQLLTGQERSMYEYLRILQGQLERMHTMMGTMVQQPGMHR
jgi:uncharacterized phage infection (PIP) family protein YhgE